MRLKQQLNLVHIPDTESTHLPSLKLPSEISTTSSKIYPSLKPLKYRRVDRTVWNHNTLPLPVTLDPLECKNIIRYLNGTNNRILNILHYNKTFTLLEDHYF